MNSIERLNEIKNKIIELEGVFDMKVLNINMNKSRNKGDLSSRRWYLSNVFN